MQVRLIVLVQNMFTLQTLLLSKFQNVRGFGTFSCLRESQLGQGLTRVTFLREGDAGMLLYATLWSEDLRLQSCEIHTDPLAIVNYSAYCKRSDEDERLSQRFNFNALLSPHAQCIEADASGGDPSATDGEGKLRRKRSLIFPGTLWCGTGSKAYGFDQLGMFESADRCCRDHDHCHHIIPAFTVNYGVFNSNFYTVSHCDCDQRFRQCLLDVNDTISSMVLYSFFHVLKVPCFELKVQKRCTKMYWWGTCKERQEAPYAIFKKPFNYNISLESQSEKSNSSKSTSKVPPGVQEIKKPKSEEKCISEDLKRGDTFFRIKTNNCSRKNREQSSADPRLHNTSIKALISRKTKERSRLSAHPSALITAKPSASTTPATAPSSKSSDALQFTGGTTTSQKVTGHQLSPEKILQSQKRHQTAQWRSG